MRIKYFSESAYFDLYDNIPNNLNAYLSVDNKWIKDFFGDREYSKESRIDSTLPTLDATCDDYANVTTLYDLFKDKLTPKQASNPYLWAYLTHIVYWEYASKRWGAEKMSIETVKQRYFCNTEDGNRIGFLRNAISRLWWIGYLSYQDGRRNPYELTKLLTSHSDICQSIIERNFSMNRNVTIGILDAILEINNDPKLRDVGLQEKGSNKYEWRDLCKYINRYGAVTLLDSLSSDDIKELSYKYILKQRND